MNEALKAQVDRLEHSTLLGLASDQSILLAERLVAITPEGLDKVFYSDNGSTAVEIGVKMAFQYQQHRGHVEKNKFITFRHAYHGDTIGAVSVGGIDIFHEVYRPLLFTTIQAPAPYCYRCELGERDPASLRPRCLEELERLMAEHHHETGGLVIEPLVQGAGGMIVQPAGFLKSVRELCDRYGILMIADEVATGFGRTGTMFACEQEGVTPDIMALSKGITGRLPAAGRHPDHPGDLRGLSRRVPRAEDLLPWPHLYRQPPGLRRGPGQPRPVRAGRPAGDLSPKIAYLEERLAGLSELAHVGDVRSCGMVGGIELVRDKETREAYPGKRRWGCRSAGRRGSTACSSGRWAMSSSSSRRWPSVWKS